MMGRVVIAAFLLSAIAAAQVANRPPVSITLSIRVFDADSKRPLDNPVNVQLMDGGGILEDEKMTDSLGAVVFITLQGYHRLRITSTDYEEYQGTFEIGEYERVKHVELVYLTAKATPGATRGAGLKGTTTAKRLAIPVRAEKEFQRGQAAMEKQQWPAARQHLEKAVALYPAYDQAFNSLGVIAVQDSDVDGARRDFRRALEINPAYAAANRNLARILLADKMYVEAEELLSRSLSVEPVNAWALRSLAYAQLQTGHYEDAVRSARRAHNLPHSGLADAHLSAAKALEALQRQTEAAGEYELYLTEDPSGAYAEQARQALIRLRGRPQP